MLLTRPQQGVALLAVLIFLEVFALLSLFALQQQEWNSQLTKRLKIRNTGLVLAEQTLTTIENHLLITDPACLIPTTPAPILNRKSLAWWRSVSCAGNFQAFQYYYVVEFMGMDACATVAGEADKMETPVAYYRVTLAFTPLSDPDLKWLLQSTMVRRATSDAVCTGPSHAVPLGRQRWQELS
jgi:Tfp pilus assembly protein PilX